MCSREPNTYSKVPVSRTDQPTGRWSSGRSQCSQETSFRRYNPDRQNRSRSLSKSGRPWGELPKRAAESHKPGYVSRALTVLTCRSRPEREKVVGLCTSYEGKWGMESGPRHQREFFQGPAERPKVETETVTWIRLTWPKPRKETQLRLTVPQGWHGFLGGQPPDGRL